MSKRIKRITAFVLSILMILTSIHFSNIWADENDNASIFAIFKDEEGNFIKDLNVDVYKFIAASSCEKVRTVTTNESGRIDVTGLTRGQYLITPDLTKYNLTENAEQDYAWEEHGDFAGFYISCGDSSQSYTGGKNADGVYVLKNKRGSISFAKKLVTINESGTGSILPLEGVTFELYDENNAVVATQTTPSNGRILFQNLKFGKYKLVETDAPEGVIINTTPIEIIVDRDDLPVSVNSSGTLYNYESHEIKIVKVDDDTREPLAGAEFGLYFDDEFQYSLKTNDDGIVVFNNFVFDKPYNKIIIKEINPPAGYMKQNVSYSYTLHNADGYNCGLVKDHETQLSNVKVPSLKVSKVDAQNNTALGGATISFYYAVPVNGGDFEFDNSRLLSELEIDPSRGLAFSIISGSEPIEINDKLVAGNAYIVKETQAPGGYDLDETEYSFVYGIENGNGGFVYPNEKTFVFKDSLIDLTGKVVVKKTDVASRALTGAEFSVFAVSDGTVSGPIEIEGQTTFAVDENGKLELELPFGDYILRETKAPEGYTKASDVNFSIASKTVVNVTVKDSKTKMTFVKTDESGAYLKGATLQILDVQGNVIKEFVTINNSYTVEGLPVGNYVLHEKEAPEGYEKAADISFSVSDNATENTTAIVMIDGLTTPTNTINISKIDVETGDYLAGSVIDIYRYISDEEFTNIMYETIENPVGTYGVEIEIGMLELASDFVEGGEGYLLKIDSITTNQEDNVYPISELLNGTYWVIETQAPDGYFLNSEPYVVDLTGDNSQIVNVTVENRPTKVEILKTDKETGDGLAGATLQLLDAEGNVIDEWVTETTAKVITGLIADATYTIHEAKAPQNYKTTSDLDFTVTENAGSGIQTITFENEKIPYEYTLNINKVEAGSDPVKYVEGAILLLEKSNGTSWDPVARWTTGSSAKTFERQTSGYYRLSEISAPDGYATASPLYFTLTNDGRYLTNTTSGASQVLNATVNITMEDEPTSIYIKKLEYGVNETPSEELAETADIVSGVTLQIFDENNNAVTSEFVTTEDENGYLIKGVLGAKKFYTVKELDAPGRFELSEPVEFYVKDTKEDQTVIVWNKHREVKYDLTLVKNDINGRPLAGAKLALYKLDPESDTIIETVAEWTSTTQPYKITVDFGKYMYSELTPPDGYQYTVSEIFTLDEDQERFEDGFIIDTTKALVDKKTKVNISKYDENNEQLPGASLEVYEVKEAVYDDFEVLDIENSILSESPIESFVTTDEVYTIEGKLNALSTYVVIETNAPGGYAIAEPVVFTVYKDGTTNVYVYDTLLETPKFNVEIEKLDYGKHILAGAKLALFKVTDDGLVQIGQDWTTVASYNASFELEPGEYVVKELTAPDGYAYAGNADYAIKFTIGDGTTTQDSENVKTNSDGLKVVDIKDAKTKVAIFKVNNEGELVAGAKLAIYDGEEQILEWTSTEDEDGFVIEGQLVAGKTYTIKELDAPGGYDIAQPVEFKVPMYAETLTVNFVNIPTQIKTYDVSFSKVEISTTNELSGAYLKLEKVTDEGNLEIDSWISNGQPHIVYGLTPGDYIFTETSAPDGYIKAEAIEFTLKEDGTSLTSQTMEDDYTKVSISKVDEDGEFVVGAVLKLEDNEGNRIATWTTIDGARTFDRLPVGTYTLYEIETPKGYETAEPMEIIVRPLATTQYFAMVDIEKEKPKYDVNITKKDITTSDELPGAKLSVTYKSGDTLTVLDSWESDENTHIVKGVVEDVVYTLTETSAPAGYVKAESIKFFVKTIDETQVIFVGKVSDDIEDFTMLGELDKEIVMYDDYTKVDIYKVNAKEKVLAGAELELYDSEGNLVESWISEETAKHFDRLPAGKYTLKEVKTPSAEYELADPFTFTIEKSEKLQVISLTNLLKEEITKYDVSISKQDITTGKELPGAVLIVKDKDGKEIEKWTSTEKAHIIYGLKYGVYTLTELTAPDGYVKAETVTFTLDKNGKSTTKVVMKDSPTKLEVYKQDKANNANIKGAALALYDSEGKLIESWTSGTSAKVFTGLKHGKYTLKETTAPNGYKLASDITFEITDTPGTVKIYMYDEKEEKTVTTTTTTPNRVQTGDENTILPFVIGGIVLMIIGAGVTVTLTKKKKEDE